MQWRAEVFNGKSQYSCEKIEASSKNKRTRNKTLNKPIFIGTRLGSIRTTHDHTHIIGQHRNIMMEVKKVPTGKGW